MKRKIKQKWGILYSTFFSEGVWPNILMCWSTKAQGRGEQPAEERRWSRVNKTGRNLVFPGVFWLGGTERCQSCFSWGAFKPKAWPLWSPGFIIMQGIKILIGKLKICTWFNPSQQQNSTKLLPSSPTEGVKRELEGWKQRKLVRNPWCHVRTKEKMLGAESVSFKASQECEILDFCLYQ